MAEVKGAIITNLDATPAVIASANQAHGRVRVFRETYVAAALASTSIIHMGRIPVGARILPQSMLEWDALGAGTVLSVAQAGNTLKAGVSAVTASILSATENRFFSPATLGYVVTTATDILVTVTGTATGTIVCTTLYVLD
jgi:hypothetical protein